MLMMRSGPHPATNAAPAGGTVLASVNRCQPKPDRLVHTEDGEENQEESGKEDGHGSAVAAGFL